MHRARFQCLTLLLSLGLLVGCAEKPRPAPQAGTPLLEQATAEPKPYYEAETGFRFTPPGNWSQQMRSTSEAGDAQGERPLVKYKRYLEGHRPAWLKISVLVDATTPLEQLLVQKVPGPRWKQVGGFDQLSVRGVPATRITWQGIYDQFDKQDFTREIVAVRRGSQVFFFSGTFTSSDETARRRIRNAVQTMDWDSGEVRGG